MGKLRKIGRRIGKGVKSLGRKLKKGFGKVAKAFGKLGPLGTIALSFILPGIGNFLTGMAGSGGVTGFIGDMAVKIGNAAGTMKNGVAKVFNRVTDAVEHGMNVVSKPFMKEGARGAGSAFRDFVSDSTGGFVEPSTTGIEDITIPGQTKVLQGPQGPIKVDVPESTISADAQIGIGGPKVPKTPKGMTDPVYIDGIDTNLKKGFYEQAEIDVYNKGIDTPIGDLNLPAGQGNVDEYLKIGPRGADTSGATIKTSPNTMPSQSGGYFNRSKNTYKSIAPIQTVGSNIIATEDAEKFATQQLKSQQAAYYAAAGSASLVRPVDPNVNFIDFNKGSPTDEDLMLLQNSYSGILTG
tara:strand:+ start:3273 stop:4331 length:1059 start_codon:yes stop_codon:yes gene_type:complete